MKLGELEATEHKKLLLVGPPGSGKTCSAIGFPYPTIVLAFEPKINSAAAWYAGDKERLDNVDVRPLWTLLDNADPIAEMNKIIREELIPQQRSGQMKYKTLVVDSISSFSVAVLNHIVKTNPGIKRSASAQGVQPTQQDYGILKREFAKLIPGLLSLPMNVVMTAHIKTDRSEITGEILRTPSMDGSYAEKLAEAFEEVYRVYMKDGKPWAQTQNDPNYPFCRSQIPRLPNPIELKYENLVRKY